MEPTLLVVGVNFRSATSAMRERFWISDARREHALKQLSRAEGIEEVIVLATGHRTEFLLWVNDVTLAGNSVMRLLSSECGLKLCEWKYFYRLLDEAALLHIFSVASSLDSMVAGEPQIVSQVKQAWQQAQKVGATGRFLDAVMEKALTISERVCAEVSISSPVGERDVIVAAAKKFLWDETHDFFGKLMARQIVPTIVALRMTLDEICRQELDSFRQENGPFSKDEDAMLVAVMGRATQRIAGFLARELKELPDKSEQELLTAAVQHLFHLQTPKAALAGATR